MELWDSIVRVTWDPAGTALVLVDFGTPMWEPVAVDGEQAVQTASFVRAAGAKHFPRGNESHRIAFALARIKDGISEAFVGRLSDVIALPKSASKPVLLSFESGEQFLFADCAIRAWPHSQEEHVTRQGLVIEAGAMTATAATYTPGAVWGET